jgi:Transglycosylase SLT domain
VLVLLTAGLALLVRDRGGGDLVLFEGEDRLVFSEARTVELERRAAAGFSHVVYAKSPGGVVATAARTRRYRAAIEATAEGSGADPELLEAIVFLESAGRPDVIAGRDPEGAAGLTQVLAETGQNLLGMRIDLQESRSLTRRITRAERRGQARRARRLRAKRRRVDERFDPQKAIAAAGRYLKLARERFGSEELAIVSYHMGIGNLEGALRAYAGAGDDEPVREIVDDEGLSYARLYFDSSPERNSEAYGLLAALGDDSATYYWRVLASREIMRLSREDPRELRRLAALQTAKGSAEEVLHPREDTEVFDDPGELEDAYRKGRLRPFPDDSARTGLRRDPRMGELAERLDANASLYRGLRPEALVLASYLGVQVRELGGVDAPLTVTSTVRDREYQAQVAEGNQEATTGYSLHTTGYAFDLLRRYRSREQALALEFVLGRLQALDLIAWAREPAAIHVAVSEEAAELLLGQE